MIYISYELIKARIYSHIGPDIGTLLVRKIVNIFLHIPFKHVFWGLKEPSQ